VSAINGSPGKAKMFQVLKRQMKMPLFFLGSSNSLLPDLLRQIPYIIKADQNKIIKFRAFPLARHIKNRKTIFIEV